MSPAVHTGRKSDVSDCEWIRELHSVGLLRGSFRPTEAIVALRAYLRHRQTRIEGAGFELINRETGEILPAGVS